MHPTIATDLARIHIAELHREAANERLARAARRRDQPARPELSTGSRWEAGERGLDPSGLVRRLLNRLRPAFAP
jgi:hypothetical protein